MTRRRAFASCRAKLAHAIAHINILKAEIEGAGTSDPTLIPLRREYDAAQGAVVYRIDRTMEVPDHWPLIVGDAIHDLRSALDHLMWQLAIVHLGRVPTAREARNIQFPEVRKLKDFATDRYLKYINTSDIDRIKPFQPYRRLNRGQLHPLPKLVRLSNIDKHRRIHLLVTIPQSASFTNRPEGFRDCVPTQRLAPNGSCVHAYHVPPRRNPRENDIMLGIFVQPTGPNPDVDWDVRLHGFVGIGRLGPAVPMLEGMAQYVAAVLNEFDPPPGASPSRPA